MPSVEELAADAAAEAPDASQGMTVLVEKMVELKAQLDAMETHRKAVQKEYDDLRKRLLPQVLGDQGLTSVKTPLGTLSVRYRSHATVPKDRQQECRDWCRANDCADLLTLEPTTAQWLVNSLITEGEPIPDFIRVFNEATAVLTRTGAAKA